MAVQNNVKNNVKTTSATKSNVKTKTSTKNTNTTKAASGRPMPGGKAPRRKKKESDFFYINRKLPCFLMMLCSLAIVAVVALNLLPAFVPTLAENDIIKLALKYTTPYRAMDKTPIDQRTEETITNENGESVTVEYQDKTQYFTLGDLLMGSVNNLTGAYDDADSTPKDDPASAAEDVTNGENVTTGTDAEETVEVSTTPFYDDYKAKEKASGYTDGIAMMIVAYAPFAIVLLLVIAIINMLKALFALFGKRVFKRFGLASIIALVCVVAIVLVGIGMISLHVSVETQAESLSFEIGRIVDLLMSTFESAPETAVAEAAAEVTEGPEAVATVELPFQANLGLIVLFALPVVCLVLSFVTRKKIPYAIFD